MMATLSARKTQLSKERRFFLGIAAALVVVTFVGFAPTYYLSGFTGAPALRPVVHLHALVFTAWMLLFLVQTGLISAKQPKIHRKLGAFGAALGLAVLVTGVWVAIEGGRHGTPPPGRDPLVFLVFPLTNIATFAVFGTIGTLRRRMPGDHKRLMLLATLSLVVTPLARITRMMSWPVPPPIGGMILCDLFLLALVAYDLKKDGKLHPVTLWGGGALLLTQPLRVVVGHSEAWQAFARGLIG